MNRMSFWWGTDVGVFLFPGFVIKTKVSLIATCFGLACVAFFFEYIKLLQARHRQKVLLLRSKQIRNICLTESSTLLNDNNSGSSLHIGLMHRGLLYAWEGLLCLSLQNLGYLLMLAVMLYDAWFLVAVIFGSGLGYFFFGQIFMKINLRNCQIIRETFCALKCEDNEVPNTSNDGESTPALHHGSSCLEDNNSCHNTQATVHVHAEQST